MRHTGKSQMKRPFHSEGKTESACGAMKRPSQSERKAESAWGTSLRHTGPNQMIVVPSWVVPGTYIENLRFLEDKNVSGVELLFFIYDDDVKSLFKKEFLSISEYKNRFLFTAHLPDTLNAESEELVQCLVPLVRHFIVHPAKFEDAQKQAELLMSWFSKYGKDKFVIENTHHGFMENMLSLLPSDTQICMDTGHLLLDNLSVLDHYKKYSDRIKEIHLHTVDIEQAKTDNRLVDHRALNADDEWFKEFLPELKQYSGVINTEVFSWEEAEKSLEVLQKCGIAISK
jgi:hypothetical protein